MTNPTSEAVEAYRDASSKLAALWTLADAPDEVAEPMADSIMAYIDTLRAALTAAEEGRRKAEAALLMASRALVQRRFDIDEPPRGVTWSASHEGYAEQVAQHFMGEAAARDAVEGGR